MVLVLGVYSISIIADFSFFKSSMTLFWVAMRLSRRVKNLLIFSCSFKLGKFNFTLFNPHCNG